MSRQLSRSKKSQSPNGTYVVWLYLWDTFELTRLRRQKTDSGYQLAEQWRVWGCGPERQHEASLRWWKCSEFSSITVNNPWSRPRILQDRGDWIMDTEDLSPFAQSCPTLCDPMYCSLPGSSLHGILQARVLEWIAISFSKGSSRPRDRTRVSRVPGRCFNLWATREAPSFLRPSWMEESPWCLEVYRFMGRQTD